MKKLKINCKKTLLALLLCATAAAHAVKLEETIAIDSYPEISPYVNVGMLQNFDNDSKTGMGLDAFIPILGTNTELFFSNIKTNSYSNKTFDGGVYFGYRHLSPEEQKLIGIYAALDFKKTTTGDYFKQITLGTEYWLHQWFFGFRMFNPIGNSESSYERAVPGIGAEIGYELSKKSEIYLEGYCLDTTDTKDVLGVKVKFNHALFSKKTHSGILDQVNLEVGLQKDKLTGNRLFLALNFKLGGSSDYTTDGVAAHMIDTISRNRVYTEKKSVDSVHNMARAISGSPAETKKPKRIACYYGYNKARNELGTGSDDGCPASFADIGDDAVIIPELGGREVLIWAPT